MYNFYNSAVYISSGNAFSAQTGAGSIVPVSRVQNLSISIDSTKQNYNFLNLGGTSVQLEYPFIDVNLGYYPTTGKNEQSFGLFFSETGNALKNLNEEKNIYISYLENGLEAIHYSGSNYSNYNIVSIGNALLKNYNVAARVGDLVSSTCQFEGLNLQVQTGAPINRQNPAVYPENMYSVSGFYTLPTGDFENNDIPALLANNVIFNIPTGSALGVILSGNNSLNIQSIEFNVSINRQTIRELGKNIKQRKISFPIELNLACTAYIDKYQSDSLNKLICDNVTQDFNIEIKKNCSEENTLKLFLKNFKLENQSITQEIGSKNQIDLNWKGYMYNFGTGCSYFSII